jgi:hypothetical protein
VISRKIVWTVGIPFRKGDAGNLDIDDRSVAPDEFLFDPGALPDCASTAASASAPESR